MDETRGTQPNTLERADLAVTGAAAPARHSRPVRLLGTLSEIADQPQLITLCSVVFAAGLVSGNRRLAAAGGRMLAAELLATALKSAIKARVDRTRPHAVEDGDAYRMEPGSAEASRVNSFPSGHTAGAVAVARALVREYPGAGTAAYGAAAAIAAIQVPRCRHYPSDLAAGAAVGLAAEALVAGAEVVLGRAFGVRSADQPGG